MQLKTATLQSYLCGQFRTRNTNETFQGEIKNIYIKNNILYVEYLWLAKRINNQWVDDSNLIYMVSLELFEISNLGDWIILSSKILNELLIIFPPSYPLAVPYRRVVGANNS